MVRVKALSLMAVNNELTESTAVLTPDLPPQTPSKNETLSVSQS